jgi:hypothetical protein
MRCNFCQQFGDRFCAPTLLGLIT